MDNLFSIFTLSFTIALVGALAPGPLLTVAISQSPVYGVKTGPLLMLGHALAEIIMVLIIVLGLSRFIQTPFLIYSISLIGGIVLIFLGLNMFRNIHSITSEEKKVSKDKVSTLPLLGLVMSLSNPYWAIWWLTIGLGLILASYKIGLVALFIFFLGHILADIGWYSIVSFSIYKGKKFISDKRYNQIMKGCGVVLIGFGFYFIISIFIKSV